MGTKAQQQEACELVAQLQHELEESKREVALLKRELNLRQQLPVADYALQNIIDR